jgi:hypothetical protein
MLKRKSAMKIHLKSTVIATVFLSVFTVIPALTAATPVLARESTLFIIGAAYAGSVYRDGYFDYHHVWHRWRGPREADAFRAQYRARYVDEFHEGLPDPTDPANDVSLRNRSDALAR